MGDCWERNRGEVRAFGWVIGEKVGEYGWRQGWLATHSCTVGGCVCTFKLDAICQSKAKNK